MRESIDYILKSMIQPNKSQLDLQARTNVIARQMMTLKRALARLRNGYQRKRDMAQAKVHVEQEAQVLVGSDNARLVEHLIKMCQVREIYQLPKSFYSATLAYLSS